MAQYSTWQLLSFYLLPQLRRKAHISTQKQTYKFNPFPNSHHSFHPHIICTNFPKSQYRNFQPYSPSNMPHRLTYIYISRSEPKLVSDPKVTPTISLYSKNTPKISNKSLILTTCYMTQLCGEYFHYFLQLLKKNILK